MELALVVSAGSLLAVVLCCAALLACLCLHRRKERRGSQARGERAQYGETITAPSFTPVAYSKRDPMTTHYSPHESPARRTRTSGALVPIGAAPNGMPAIPAHVVGWPPRLRTDALMALPAPSAQDELSLRPRPAAAGARDDVDDAILEAEVRRLSWIEYYLSEGRFDDAARLGLAWRTGGRGTTVRI